MNLTGSDIRELLTISSSMKRGILQISGGSYAFSNRTVDDFELKDVLIQGEPLVATRSYRVVTSGFLADGGDEFKTFKRGRNLQVVPLQRELVRTYVKARCASGPLTLTVEGRVKRDL